MRREHTKYMLLKVKNETCYFIISVLPECTWFPPPRFILPYCSMYTALSDQSVWCQSDNCQPWLGRSQDQKASFFFFLSNENLFMLVYNTCKYSICFLFTFGAIINLIVSSEDIKVSCRTYFHKECFHISTSSNAFIWYSILPFFYLTYLKNI